MSKVKNEKKDIEVGVKVESDFKPFQFLHQLARKESIEVNPIKEQTIESPSEFRKRLEFFQAKSKKLKEARKNLS